MLEWTTSHIRRRRIRDHVSRDFKHPSYEITIFNSTMSSRRWDIAFAGIAPGRGNRNLQVFAKIDSSYPSIGQGVMAGRFCIHRNGKSSLPRILLEGLNLLVESTSLLDSLFLSSPCSFARMLAAPILVSVCRPGQLDVHQVVNGVVCGHRLEGESLPAVLFHIVFRVFRL